MAAKNDDAATGDASVSFEQAAERLTAIVAQLESGELKLEDSLELFEEGVRVARNAQAQLDHAEQRVEELLAVDEDGQTQTRDFE
jgi:exodeoxyribonuclease VII small subunit